MASKTVLTRIQWLIWIVIYGGLLSIVLAHFVEPADPGTAFWLRGAGAAFVVLGVILIYLRSRLKESP